MIFWQNVLYNIIWIGAFFVLKLFSTKFFSFVLCHLCETNCVFHVFLKNFQIKMNYTQICLIIAPPWKKNSLFFREGGGAIIRHTKNIFFWQKFQNILFFQFFPKILLFFFPKIIFLLRNLQSIVGDQKFKNIFFRKKIFSKIVCTKFFF